jgi:hypothetical protein
MARYSWAATSSDTVDGSDRPAKNSLRLFTHSVSRKGSIGAVPLQASLQLSIARFYASFSRLKPLRRSYTLQKAGAPNVRRSSPGAPLGGPRPRPIVKVAQASEEVRVGVRQASPGKNPAARSSPSGQPVRFPRPLEETSREARLPLLGLRVDFLRSRDVHRATTPRGTRGAPPCPRAVGGSHPARSRHAS